MYFSVSFEEYYSKKYKFQFSVEMVKLFESKKQIVYITVANILLGHVS